MREQFLRRAVTLKNTDRDFVSWHQGRSEYYFWAISIKQADWIEAFGKGHCYLERFLLTGYRRQPHITILPAGFNNSTDLNDTGLAEVCHSVEPFELSLGGLESFTSCPCFEVHDSTASLLTLRTKLKRILCDPICMESDQAYSAHVTVGLYDAEYPTHKLVKLMDQFEFKPVKPIRVTEFVLASYLSSSISGPIEVVAEFSLGSNGGG